MVGLSEVMVGETKIIDDDEWSTALMRRSRNMSGLGLAELTSNDRMRRCDRHIGEPTALLCIGATPGSELQRLLPVELRIADIWEDMFRAPAA